MVQFYCKNRKKWQETMARDHGKRPWQESDGFIMQKTNKKAFTLIELLAVIVILALIMSIAVFSMSGVLDSSKTNAKNRNIEGILDAVSKTYKTAMLSGTNLNLPIEATISSDGVITLIQNSNEVVVNYDGTKPNGGKILIDRNGKVYADSVTFEDGYMCSMTTGDKGCSKVTVTSNLPSTSAIDLIVSKNNTTENLVPDVNVTGRRVFKGADASVNNYIELYENGSAQLYRIISIESDGTLKVIRDKSVTSMAWDSGSGYNVIPATGARYNEMNTYCGLYRYSGYIYYYYGCNAWRAVTGNYTNGSKSGIVNQDSIMMQYLNNTFYNMLDESIQELIISRDWDIGPVLYGATVESAQSQTQADKWIGKIGLMSYMDWFNATTNSCQEPTSINGGYLDFSHWNRDYYTCGFNNYLYKDYNQWTISIEANYGSSFAFAVNSNGGFADGAVFNSYGARPAFYLTSNIQLSGEGTSTSPFKIS